MDATMKFGVGYGVEIVDALLKKHRRIYVGATRHPFILNIRDGTVDFSVFKRWLGQDYLFVRAFVPFVASVLVKAWNESDNSSDMEVILGGLTSLNEEIEWFKKEATKWDIHLSEIVPQKPNEHYCRFMESLMSPEVEYAVAITALWAIETVYQQSFAHCLEDESKTPPELKETCERWGNEGFARYCNTLKKIANRRLDVASEEVLKRAEVAMLRVFELEVEFFNMSRANPQRLAPPNTSH